MLPLLLPSKTSIIKSPKKKTGKEIAQKVFDKKGDKEQTNVERSTAIVKAPSAKLNLISTDFLKGEDDRDYSKIKKSSKVTDVLDGIKKILDDIANTIKNSISLDKSITRFNFIKKKKEESKKKEEKMETNKEKFSLKGILSKFNIPFFDRIQTFFTSILIGSLVLFLIKQAQQIVETIKSFFDKIKEIWESFKPFVMPIWDGLKWVVSEGLEFVAKIMGVPSQEAERNKIEENLSEIMKKIPGIDGIIKQIENTIKNLIGSPDSGGTSGAPPGPSSYAPGTVPSEVVADVNFTQGVTKLAKKYNVPEDYLYAVMGFETGGTFNPAITNKAGSGATGLIQFMPSTARGLGTTTGELSLMTRAEQLKYVDRYFAGTLNESASLSDVYMSVLLPAAVGKPEDTVLFGPGGILPGAYRQNKGLDLNGDGKITKAEATSKVVEYLPSGFQPPASTTPVPSATPSQATPAAPVATPTQPLVPTPSAATLPGVEASSQSLTPSTTTPQLQTVPEITPTQTPMQRGNIAAVERYTEYERPTMQGGIIPIPVGQQSGPTIISNGGRVVSISVSKKELLNSYYQSQLVGFLYKQG